MASLLTSRRSFLGLCLAVVPAFMWSHTSGGKSAQHSDESGIEGIVLLGPACPGPERPDRPCPEVPYNGSLVIKRVSDQQNVAQTDTGENGRFRVSLPPGKYFIVNAPGPAYPRIHSPEIIVRRNRFSTVNIHADTGMR
jgi:hypothetical protein